MNALLFSLLIAGWGPCQSGGSPEMEWTRVTVEPNQWALWQRDRQIGCWDSVRKVWRPYNPATKEWGPEVAWDGVREKFEPIGAPSPVAEAMEKIPNFGVDFSKFKKCEHDECFTRSGEKVARWQAFDALEPKLPDDSSLLRVTVIGTESERKEVLADLRTSPALTGLRSKIIVQDYSPDEWAVSRSGFDCTGKPGICLQTPSGKVLHRQSEYRGPDKLAQAIAKAEKLRQKDPNYKPEKDPDLNKASPLPSPDSSPGFPWLVALPFLIGIAIILFSGRKKV